MIVSYYNVTLLNIHFFVHIYFTLNALKTKKNYNNSWGKFTIQFFRGKTFQKGLIIYFYM